MTAPHQRSRRLVAIPLGMAVATALAVVPNVTASAAETTGRAAYGFGTVDALDAVRK